MKPSSRFLWPLARAVDLAKYRKHPRGPKKPKPKRTMHAGTAPRFHRQALGEETMTLPRDSEGPRSYRHVSFLNRGGDYL